MTTRIIGIGACVPDTIVTNNDLTAFLDTNDEWIRERTGIGERRVSTEMGRRPWRWRLQSGPWRTRA